MLKIVGWIIYAVGITISMHMAKETDREKLINGLAIILIYFGMYMFFM